MSVITRAKHRARYADRKSRGLCTVCTAERGDDGTAAHCRPCADATNEISERAAVKRRARAKEAA